MVKKGTWVLITQTILKPLERSAHVPLDTMRVPFVARIKGWLTDDAAIGDDVSVKTVTGRIESGTLSDIEPYDQHSFGHHVDALQDIKAIIDSETETIT